MHGTELDLRARLAAIYTVLNAFNGISSVELVRLIGVSQKAAWKAGHAIRDMMRARTMRARRPRSRTPTRSRAAPPAFVETPRIHMGEIDVTRVPNGADSFALNLLDFDHGLSDGWPYAFHETTLKVSEDSGATFVDDDRGRGVLDYMIPLYQTYNFPTTGQFKLSTAVANDHGTAASESNVVEVFNGSGAANIT